MSTDTPHTPDFARLTDDERELLGAYAEDFRQGGAVHDSLIRSVQQMIAGRVITAQRDVAAAIRADIQAEIEGEDVLAVRAGLDFAANIARVYQNRYTRDEKR